jgi:fimbrial chaperone protein
MKRIWSIAILTIATLIPSVGTGFAARLQVVPILLELSAPAAAGILTLRNEEDFEVTVQTRVFRWSQADGKESLDPTTDVVASPPAVKLAPGAEYTVRVVRISKQPVQGEESYRVIVDQLPDARPAGQSAINILLRQSIPVFFRAGRVAAANVSWSLRREGGKLVVVARNDGDERLRIASLRLRDAAGATIDFGNGLVGYALGRSTMTFIVPRTPGRFAARGPVTIAAESNNGTIHAVVPMPPGR